MGNSKKNLCPHTTSGYVHAHHDDHSVHQVVQSCPLELCPSWKKRRRQGMSYLPHAEFDPERLFREDGPFLLPPYKPCANHHAHTMYMYMYMHPYHPLQQY